MKAGVTFAWNVDSSPDGIFSASLRARGLVPLLANIVGGLVSRFHQDGVETTFGKCTRLLDIQLSHPSSFKWLPEALRADLLRTIVCFANVTTSAIDTEYLKRLMTGLTASTVYFSVLRDLGEALPGAAAIFVGRKSVIADEWPQFVSLTETRLGIKKKLDSSEYLSQVACDSLQCGGMQVKLHFRTCAGCRSVHYCNKGCQRIDWVRHRTVCRRLRSLHLSQDGPRYRSTKQ
ncbi:hypothetical protein B0H11DRAFT_652261 [Mycena galericulata]|nr:hypothetical protein B0H11DRAFT_652261 [Mycena galericulata]